MILLLPCLSVLDNEARKMMSNLNAEEKEGGKAPEKKYGGNKASIGKVNL